MGSTNQNQIDIEQYQKAFDNFDKFLEKINSENPSDEIRRGYLINWTNFNKLKKYVEKYKKKNDIACLPLDENISFKLNPENYEDLEQQIFEGDYKFKIINGTLLRIIWDKKEEEFETYQIEYSITSENIKIILKNGKELNFKNNKDNTIGKEKSTNYLTNNEDIKKIAEKIYKDIINYFKSTTEFSEKINNKNKEIKKYEGFLVNKEWVEKWKKYSYYNKIKENYLKDDDKNKIIEKIKKEHKKSKFNYNEVNDIENYIIKDINQLESNDNLNKSFEILNKNFLKSFNKKNIDIFDFVLTYNNIEMKYQDEPLFSYKADNNIIIMDSNTITDISNKIKSNKIQVQKKDTPQIQKNLDNNLDSEGVMNKDNEKKIYNENQTKNNFEKANEKNSDKSNNNNFYLIDKKFSELISSINFNKSNIDNNIYSNDTMNPQKIDLNSDLKKYQIQFGYINSNSEKLYFPINFDIVSPNSLNNINNKNILDKSKKYIFEEIDLIQVNEYFFIISKDNNNFKNENDNLIYLYSIKFNEGKNSYEPISIIKCHNIELNDREKLIKLLTKINKNRQILNNPKILENEFKITCYLIKENNRKSEENENMNSQNKMNISKKEEKNLDSFLMFAIEYLKERDSFIKTINQNFIKDENNQKKEYYLINKNYLNIVKKIFHLKKIKTIIDDNKEKNEKELVKIITEKLSETQKSKLKELNNDLIQNDLNDEEISKITLCFIDDNKSKGFCYFKDCELITKNIRNLLKKFDGDVKSKSKKVYCVFDEDKIIILLDNNILNIAYIQNKNILVKYIIKSNKANSLFNMITQKGYNYISEYLSYTKTEIKIKDKNHNSEKIPVEIHKISLNEKNISDISYKLKVLILLTIFQNNLSEKKQFEAYMINPEWLKEFKYKKIKILIEEKGETQNLNLQSNDLKSISNIIQYLDQEKLKKLDEVISSFELNSLILFDSPIEKLKLKDKYLLLYKNFVLVDKKLAILFQKYFGVYLSNYNISFIHKEGEGDIIIMKEYPLFNKQNPNQKENLILLGYYDNSDKLFSIKYILEYVDLNILNSELSYIMDIDIKHYIKERTDFDPKNEDNYICQIIKHNKIIGNFYKYEEGFEYTKDNSKNLDNKQIINSIYIYANKMYIKNKLRYFNYDSNDEEFYFVKKQYYSELKRDNNYKQLKKYLIGKINNFPSSNKEIQNIIKNLSKEDLNIINNIEVQNNPKQSDPSSFEIDIIPILNPNNSSESFMIYQDFKIIEKKCAQILLKDINKIPYTVLKCSFFNNNMIIFHYPTNIFENKNYICVISKIDEKINFINEYLLKYNDFNSYEHHLKKLKRLDLNSYLQNLNFVNNTAPIEEQGYIEIGTIIKIGDSTPPPPPSPPIPLPPIPKIRSTRKNFPSKPLVGLENIGATCYMNATLQCLCNIEKFVDYFKYNEHLYEIIKND